MNYRHLYHAGNFADVLKHGLLCWALRYLQQKEAPLCLIDTHAGRGVYDLSAPEARKTGEADLGVARVLAARDVPAALAPYVDALRAMPAGTYPGSPLLMARLARERDRVLACELQPDEAAALREAARGLRHMRICEEDGYRKLPSLVPPPEKRGLVLIDPPFEQPDELSALAAAFIAAQRKWPTGVFLLWFPLKDRARFDRFRDELRSAGVPKLALCTLDVDRSEGLGATGVVLANAPFTLEADWKPALAWLAATLAQGANPAWSFESLGLA